LPVIYDDYKVQNAQTNERKLIQNDKNR